MSGITALAPIVVAPAVSTATSAVATVGTTAGEAFAKFLGGAVDTIGRAEGTSIAALQNKASLQSVVDSIIQAEQTLQTVLAVRDKAVAAWQDVSRMSI